MKSYVVVTVEGGLVQSTDLYQGDEPGVIEPIVIDYDYEDEDDEGIATILNGYERDAQELPADWFVTRNIITTIEDERKRFGLERDEDGIIVPWVAE